MASKRNPKNLHRQASELALAVPQIVAHRLTRMAIAGAAPSRRDRSEFKRMSEEKVVAFTDAWAAMGWAALRANQTLGPAIWASLAPAKSGGLPPAASLVDVWNQAALAILGAGIAPVHRTAVANAKRLATTRLF